MDDLEKKVKGEKATLPPPPPPPKPPKKKKPVTTKKSEAEKKEARKLGGGPEYENELVEPPAGSKPGEVKFEWRGMGKNSGEILELELKNTTDRPGEISLVPGLLLTPPSGSSFQPFVLGLNPAIKIPANGTTKAVVRGYCLDRNVQPPTAGQQVDFQVGVELGKYSQQVRCVWKGLELERSGALHDDLGERHAETVIQRAIWSSQGESPQDLAKDIQDQVKEAGLDRTPEEVAELTQHLTEDVSKVVEASSASTPLKLRCPDIK